MRSSAIALVFIMLFAGVAFAGDASSWGYRKRDGTYMEPQRRSMPMVPYRSDSTPAQRDAGQQADKQKKKRIDPYDNKYDSNYRPRF